MYKVRFYCQWETDDNVIEKELRKNIPNNGDTWKNIQITNNDDADFYVIFASPHAHQKFDKKRTIVFQTEPLPLRKNWGQWYIPNESEFLWAKTIPSFKSVFHTWYINKTYNEIVNDITPKTKLLSSVIGTKGFLPGHITRMNFCSNYLDKLPYYDHYGRGRIGNMQSYKGDILNKENALFPYYYHFNAENYIEDNWFTEKLTDPILCNTLPFYYGSETIKTHINPDSYVFVDITKPSDALYTITNCIKNNEYEKRYVAIQDEKIRLLNELNTMNIVWKIINESI